MTDMRRELGVPTNKYRKIIVLGTNDAEVSELANQLSLATSSKRVHFQTPLISSESGKADAAAAAEAEAKAPIPSTPKDPKSHQSQFVLAASQPLVVLPLPVLSETVPSSSENDKNAAAAAAVDAKTATPPAASPTTPRAAAPASQPRTTRASSLTPEARRLIELEIENARLNEQVAQLQAVDKKRRALMHEILEVNKRLANVSEQQLRDYQKRVTAFVETTQRQVHARDQQLIAAQQADDAFAAGLLAEIKTVQNTAETVVSQNGFRYIPIVAKDCQFSRDHKDLKEQKDPMYADVHTVVVVWNPFQEKEFQKALIKKTLTDVLHARHRSHVEVIPFIVLAVTEKDKMTLTAEDIDKLAREFSVPEIYGDTEMQGIRADFSAAVQKKYHEASDNAEHRLSESHDSISIVLSNRDDISALFRFVAGNSLHTKGEKMLQLRDRLGDEKLTQTVHHMAVVLLTQAIIAEPDTRRESYQAVVNHYLKTNQLFPAYCRLEDAYNENYLDVNYARSVVSGLKTIANVDVKKLNEAALVGIAETKDMALSKLLEIAEIDDEGNGHGLGVKGTSNAMVQQIIDRGLKGQWELFLKAKATLCDEKYPAKSNPLEAAKLFKAVGEQGLIQGTLMYLFCLKALGRDALAHHVHESLKHKFDRRPGSRNLELILHRASHIDGATVKRKYFPRDVESKEVVINVAELKKSFDELMATKPGNESGLAVSLDLKEINMIEGPLSTIVVPVDNEGQRQALITFQNKAAEMFRGNGNAMQAFRLFELSSELRSRTATAAMEELLPQIISKCDSVFTMVDFYKRTILQMVNSEYSKTKIQRKVDELLQLKNIFTHPLDPESVLIEQFVCLELPAIMLEIDVAQLQHNQVKQKDVIRATQEKLRELKGSEEYQNHKLGLASTATAVKSREARRAKEIRVKAEEQEDAVKAKVAADQKARQRIIDTIVAEAKSSLVGSKKQHDAKFVAGVLEEATIRGAAIASLQYPETGLYEQQCLAEAVMSDPFLQEQSLQKIVEDSKGGVANIPEQMRTVYLAAVDQYHGFANQFRMKIAHSTAPHPSWRIFEIYLRQAVLDCFYEAHRLGFGEVLNEISKRFSDKDDHPDVVAYRKNKEAWIKFEQMQARAKNKDLSEDIRQASRSQLEAMAMAYIGDGTHLDSFIRENRRYLSAEEIAAMRKQAAECVVEIFKGFVKEQKDATFGGGLTLRSHYERFKAVFTAEKFNCNEDVFKFLLQKIAAKNKDFATAVVEAQRIKQGSASSTPPRRSVTELTPVPEQGGGAAASAEVKVVVRHSNAYPFSSPVALRSGTGSSFTPLAPRSGAGAPSEAKRHGATLISPLSAAQMSLAKRRSSADATSPMRGGTLPLPFSLFSPTALSGSAPMLPRINSAADMTAVVAAAAVPGTPIKLQMPPSPSPSPAANGTAAASGSSSAAATPTAPAPTAVALPQTPTPPGSRPGSSRQ